MRQLFAIIFSMADEELDGSVPVTQKADELNIALQLLRCQLTRIGRHIFNSKRHMIEADKMSCDHAVR